MLAPTFDARLTAARALSPSVRELSFERVDGADFTFEPGQWVSLVLQAEEGELRRAYSIASPPARTGRPSSFDLAVTRVEAGAGSKLLHALEPGQVIRVIGPQGFFTRPLPAAPPALFVGTGTGLAPLRSMIYSALALSEPTPLCLLFGARSEADILYHDELAELAREHPRFRLEVTLSRGSDAWRGNRGYVQAHARTLYEQLAAQTGEPPHVYACGLERMIGAVRTLFRNEMGLARLLIHTERYD